MKSPPRQMLDEDASLAFTSAAGRAVSLADVDAGGADISATLSVTSGTLRLLTVNGLTFTAGANGAASFTAKGTLAALNLALSGLVYRPTANAFGADLLTVFVDDRGNSGSGGAKSDTKTVAIEVNSVNDAPVATVPAFRSFSCAS